MSDEQKANHEAILRADQAMIEKYGHRWAEDTDRQYEWLNLYRPGSVAMSTGPSVSDLQRRIADLEACLREFTGSNALCACEGHLALWHLKERHADRCPVSRAKELLATPLGDVLPR